MKNLFNTPAYEEILERIEQLNELSPRLWGEMDAAQMLAHCAEAFKVPLSDKPMPRVFAGVLFGWIMKKKLYNDVPWGRNLPTAPNFIIKGEKNFEFERQNLLSYVEKFYLHGRQTAGKFPHPFFGNLTQEQWGMSMYKHLDHHLQQFGV